MTQQIKIQKQTVENKNNTTEHLGTKRTRGNCEAEASPPPQKKNQNSEDPSGSIRDITAHLIHDKNTSIAEPCTVFNVPSVGCNPSWI